MAKKQCSICLLFTLHASHQTTNYPKVTKSVLSQSHIKQKKFTNINHKIFKELVPSVLRPDKKHIRLGLVGIKDHSINLLIPDFKKRNGQKQQKNSKILYKCIKANTSVIWQHAAHATDQLSSPNC